MKKIQNQKVFEYAMNACFVCAVLMLAYTVIVVFGTN